MNFFEEIYNRSFDEYPVFQEAAKKDDSDKQMRKDMKRMASTMTTEIKNAASNPGKKEAYAEIRANGGALESSAATLGAMHPVVPLTEDDSALVKYVVQESAEYDVYVEEEEKGILSKIKGGFDENFKEPLKESFLPYKIQMIIIKKSVLGAKLKWMKRFSPNSPKIGAVSKKYMEYDKAITKFRAGVASIQDKEKIEKEIARMEKEANKKVNTQVAKKKAMMDKKEAIQEGIDEGYLPSNYEDIDAYLEDVMNSFIEEYEYVTEGANWQIHKAIKRHVRKFKKSFKLAKKALRKKELAVAKKHIRDAEMEIAAFDKEVHAIDANKVSTTFIGTIIGATIHQLYPEIINGFVGGGVLGAAHALGEQSILEPVFAGVFAGSYILAPMMSLYRQIMSVIESLNDKRKHGEEYDISVVNLYRGSVLKMIKEMRKAVYEISKRINKMDEEELERSIAYNKLKKEQKEALTKESAVLTRHYYEEVLPYMEDDECDIYDDFFMEGANWQIHKAIKAHVKSFCKESRLARKAIKNKDIGNAKIHYKKAGQELAAYRKKIEGMDTGSITSTVIGYILTASVHQMYPELMLSIVSSTMISSGASFVSKAVNVGSTASKLYKALTPLGYAFTLVGNGLSLYGSIRSIVRTVCNAINVMNEYKRRGKDIDHSILNSYYGSALALIKKMEKIQDDLEKLMSGMTREKLDVLDKQRKEVAKGKKKSKASVKKESVDDDFDFDQYEMEAYECMKFATEMYESDFCGPNTFMYYFFEAKKPDDGMMEILQTLNSKGYKTKYSCSGHKASWKEDRNDDGIINGKLTTSARIMFKGDYKFPPAPKHWGWKTVEGADYLYVMPMSHNADKIDADKAFAAWKNKYMASLKRWVDNLPDASTANKTVIKKNNVKEKDVMESYDIEFAELADEIFLEA